MDRMVAITGSKINTPVSKMKSIRLLVNGIVQGVGFRPFVYRLAVEENCTGSVMNSPDGVIIEIQGTTKSVEKFQLRLVNETPPLARIEKLEVQEISRHRYSRI